MRRGWEQAEGRPIAFHQPIEEMASLSTRRIPGHQVISERLEDSTRRLPGDRYSRIRENERNYRVRIAVTQKFRQSSDRFLKS